MADSGWFIATILSLPKGTEPSTPLLELDVDELLMCPSVRVPTIDVLRAVLPFGEQVANNRWLLVPAGMEALARQSD